MNYKTLSINVKNEPRGNRHGYLPSDYARDAALEIEKEMANLGIKSWPIDDVRAEKTAIDYAHEEIYKCSDMFRDKLSIEITEECIEE